MMIAQADSRAVQDDIRRRADRIGSGTAESSFRVYGCCGSPKTFARGPISTISPRYIIATRWLIRSTTAMSWLMNR